jgi:endonuclease YncB( thermonuclease family)
MRGLAATVVLVAVAGAACSNGTDTPSTVDEQETTSSSITIPDSTEHGIVSGVVDGDTVQIMVGEEPKVVNLAGIRAPQGDECYAAEASLVVADVVAGRSVALVGDATDAEGTPLRYLIIDEDVPILVNVELVDRGAAVALHGHELAGDFLRVNDAAYASGKGMWGTFVCGHPPQGVAPDRPQLRIEAINIPGAESQDSGSIEIVNASYTEVRISGWTMRDATNASSFTFPGGTVLAAGDNLSVMMSCESDSPAWCVDADLWSAGGNTVIMTDDLGNVVDRRVHEVVTEP